jgi:hypothetical protein
VNIKIFGGMKIMWLYLTTGFYSVVNNVPCEEDELLVRARSKVDLDNLQEILKTKYHFDGEVLDTPKADYAYRMIVPRQTFASFISSAVNNLVYDNFKNSKCWEAMYKWQQDLNRGKQDSYHRQKQLQ